LKKKTFWIELIRKKLRLTKELGGVKKPGIRGTGSVQEAGKEGTVMRRGKRGHNVMGSWTNRKNYMTLHNILQLKKGRLMSQQKWAGMVFKECEKQEVWHPPVPPFPPPHYDAL